MAVVDCLGYVELITYQVGGEYNGRARVNFRGVANFAFDKDSADLRLFSMPIGMLDGPTPFF